MGDYDKDYVTVQGNRVSLRGKTRINSRCWGQPLFVCLAPPGDQCVHTISTGVVGGDHTNDMLGVGSGNMVCLCVYVVARGWGVTKGSFAI